MVKSYLILFLMIVSIIGYSQNAKPMNRIENTPADTSSYKIILNKNNLDINNDLEIRKKINFYRKKEDYTLEINPDLKILIYKK
jgi:hypothetical protein